jgi:hypothetical protein
MSFGWDSGAIGGIIILPSFVGYVLSQTGYLIRVNQSKNSELIPEIVTTG